MYLQALKPLHFSAYHRRRNRTLAHSSGQIMGSRKADSLALGLSNHASSGLKLASLALVFFSARSCALVSCSRKVVLCKRKSSDVGFGGIMLRHPSEKVQSISQRTQ
jgi:hypothetical protein